MDTPFSRNIGAGTTRVSPTDYQLNIDTTDGEVTIILPDIAELYRSFTNNFGNPSFASGFKFKDVGNNAGANKIYFVGQNGDTVNSISDYFIAVNGVSGIIFITGYGNYCLYTDVNVSTESKPYILNAINLPNLDVDIRAMRDLCMEIRFTNVKLKSFKPAENNILSNIQIDHLTLGDTLHLYVNRYGNLKTLTLVNVNKMVLHDIELSTTLESIFLGDLPDLLEWNLGSLDGIKTLKTLNLYEVQNLLSVGSISNLPVLTSILMTDFDGASIGNISSNLLLSSVQITGVDPDTTLVSVGSISNNPSLLSLEISTCDYLITIGSLLGNTSCLQYVLNENALSSTNVSQILIDIDTNGLSGGVIDLSGGTNAGLGSLTISGVSAYNNLIVKSWTININP